MSKASTWIKTLKDRQLAIGKERDKLREAISDMESLEECCTTAYDNIQYAIDALSELT